MITFVRVVRAKNQKRGLAIDKAGKFWTGFCAHTTFEEIRLSGSLKGAGLCFVCQDIFIEGWGCISSEKEERDLCDNCIVFPKLITLVDFDSDDEKWKQLVKEFKKPNFNHDKWSK